MYDNHVYNLMMQLTQEHQSLWRIKKHYLGEAAECEECKVFWEKMQKQKEGDIEELKALLKKHICE